MPNKRKRDSSDDKIERYKKKIRKIEKKRERELYRQRIILQSSSESDNESNVDFVGQNELELEPCNNTGEAVVEPEETPPTADPAPSTDAPAEVEDNATPADKEDNTLPELDPELLMALGEETGVSPKFGEKIHLTLAQRWTPILKKGLPKEVKDKLLKEYLVPENCTLLQAPKLNVEVAAAISETARSRDKRKETDQQQLAIGITAVSKAMTTLLTSDNKVEAIRLLSDGCRILTDLHYQETHSRISVINYSLAKPFLNIVQDCERDETLYGVKLSDKIKASKLIEKQGLQIKKYTKTQKTPSSEQTTSANRPQYQQGTSSSGPGNWPGPSRFQQTRGGRRGSRRPPTMSYRKPPAQVTTSTNQAATQSKSRTATRQ